MLSGRARREQLFKYLCEAVITILILTHFQEKCMAHNTVILDVSHPPPYINHPFPRPSFFICASSHFPLSFFFSAVPWTLSLSHSLSPSTCLFLCLFFPMHCLLGCVLFCQPAPLMLVCFVIPVILWAFPATLLMLERINTSEFDSINVLGLGTLPHTTDICCYTCQVALQKLLGAVDAGSLPDDLKHYLKQIALI